MRRRPSVRRGALSASAALGAIALALGAAAVPASANVADDGTVTLDLLSITDFHGALLRSPNIAAQVTAMRDANPDTVFSAAGDSIGGTTFESAIDRDAPTIDVLNQAGLQVSAVGNHEFDQGFADLSGRVESRADFPYLAANVTGQTALPPYWITTTPSGVTVGYIGTVTTQTPTVVSPDGVAGLGFDDPVTTTNRYAAQLSDGNPANGEADVVVALLHEGTEVVREDIGPNVDAVFTGHSHETLPAAPTAQAPNPVAPETPSGAPVVQAGASGTVLGHIRLTVAPDGTVADTVAENIPVNPYAVSNTSPTPAEFDTEVAATVRAAYANAQTLGAREVGSITAPFNTASNNNPTLPQHRGTESPLGNLLAEVYLAKVNEFGLDADFGIMNPGGIRSDLDPNADGIVSYREAFNVTPFGNTIGTVDLTGEQVVTMLEQQFIERPPRPMLALGLSPGLTYLYDPAAPVGERVTAVFLDGEPIDPAATYRVASNTFLLAGGDQFTVFRDGENLQETGVTDVTAFNDFLAANPDLTPTYLQQSVGLTEITDLTQPIPAGENVTVELSSLSFTSTEPKPETVTARFVGSGADAGAALDAAPALDTAAAEPGDVLAEQEIDNDIVVDSNETGRAAVTFAVPEDAADGPFTVQYEWTTADVTQFLALTFDVEAAAVPPTEEPEETTAPPTPPTSGTDDDPVGEAAQSGGSGGSLPQTGFDTGWAVGGIALLTFLAGAALLARRRLG